jgi:hypothetical protein
MPWGCCCRLLDDMTRLGQRSAVAEWDHGQHHCLRIVRRYRNAGDLCAGGSQPVVHLSLCDSVCIGLGVWIPSGSVAWALVAMRRLWLKV